MAQMAKLRQKGPSVAPDIALCDSIVSFLAIWASSAILVQHRIRGVLVLAPKYIGLGGTDVSFEHVHQSQHLNRVVRLSVLNCMAPPDKLNKLNNRDM